MKGTVYLYEVSHPDYPTVTVPSIGPDSATVEAARRWGVPELWGRLAGYCTVRRGGRAARPRCTRCGREFGTAGQAAGKCPDCLRSEELHRRQMANIRGSDRPAGDAGMILSRTDPYGLRGAVKPGRLPETPAPPATRDKPGGMYAGALPVTCRRSGAVGSADRTPTRSGRGPAATAGKRLMRRRCDGWPPPDEISARLPGSWRSVYPASAGR